MGSYGYLYVGNIEVSGWKNGIPGESLAVFRDDMYRCSPSDDELDDSDDPVDDENLVHEYVGPGRAVSDRLDALGFTPQATLSLLDLVLADAHAMACQPTLFEGTGIDFPGELDSEAIALKREAERQYLEAYGGREWVSDLRKAIHSETPQAIAELGGMKWLMSHLSSHYADDLDFRFVLRSVLLATPQSDVRLDVTDLVEEGWVELDEDSCASSLEALRASGIQYAPIVVLTEGKTDIQVLEPALQIIYPHLTDLIRFMDYSERPLGGAGALVNTVRSFAAAGIANRIVALFDNDTAASDALRKANAGDLPANIRVLQYPYLGFAESYPTLGPPTAASPKGQLAVANINGLACSIELYVGIDVLTTADGSLCPVQWRSYIEGQQQYQGEIINKRSVLDQYQQKVRAAMEDRNVIPNQDWSGLRSILDIIRHAFD